jgi:hypothetical protein
VAAASSAALQQDVNVLQGETERLSVELNQVLSEFGAVQTDAEQVQGEVIELVRHHTPPPIHVPSSCIFLWG